MAAAALAASLAASPAPAAVIVTFNEVGNDVVGSFSGSLDLPFLVGSLNPNSIGPVSIYPLGGVFFTPGSPPPASLDLYFASGPSQSFAHDYGIGFSPTLTTLGNIANGDAFLISQQGVLGVPIGYISGAPLSGSFTFSNQSFMTMSVLPGTFTFTLYNTSTDQYDGDIVTLQFNGASAVPLPATLPLLLGTLGMAAIAARRVKRRWEAR